MRKIVSCLLAFVMFAALSISVSAEVTVECNASGYVIDLSGSSEPAVQFTAQLHSSDSPVDGILVIFILFYPDGSFVRKTDRTNGVGQAKTSFKLDQTGSYILSKGLPAGRGVDGCSESFSVVRDGTGE